MPTFYEFFAGGGMVRAGLGNEWECLFANDFDKKKAAVYGANWGCERLRVDDIGCLTTADLPGRADLAWASFPCQDLSLAGGYEGLRGKRSGTFWEFWRLVKELEGEGRAPRTIALENVCGALSSHEGKDFGAIGEALAKARYQFGALVIDAARFLPQSRPRLFIVGVRREGGVPEGLRMRGPDPSWHPANLIEAYKKLPKDAQEAYVWWRMPAPAPRSSRFSDVVENETQDASWHERADTERLLAMMSPLNQKKVEQAARMGRRMVGCVYRRTRLGEGKKRVQRAEIRFDDVAGCLRTPAGGSSRQTIMIVDGNELRSRLLSAREAARLMGLPESYKLPTKYNDAYHLAGDGVVVPVVRFLAANLLEPLLAVHASGDEEAA